MTLKLQKSFGMGNMTLIDHQGYPYHFKNAVHCLDVYYQAMIELFTTLIQTRIADAKTKLDNLREKRRLIKLIVEEIIVVFKQPDDHIHAQLEEHKIDPVHWDKLGAKEMSTTKITKLDVAIVEQELEVSALASNTPQKEWMHRLTVFRHALDKEKYK